MHFFLLKRTDTQEFYQGVRSSGGGFKSRWDKPSPTEPIMTFLFPDRPAVNQALRDLALFEPDVTFNVVALHFNNTETP